MNQSLRVEPPFPQSQRCVVLWTCECVNSGRLFRRYFHSCRWGIASSLKLGGWGVMRCLVVRWAFFSQTTVGLPQNQAAWAEYEQSVMELLESFSCLLQYCHLADCFNDMFQPKAVRVSCCERTLIIISKTFAPMMNTCQHDRSVWLRGDAGTALLTTEVSLRIMRCHVPCK